MTVRRDAHAEALTELSRELGGAPPRDITALSTEELRTLTRAIAEARERHSAALSAAIDDAFGQVPALLRRPVKRVVLR